MRAASRSLTYDNQWGDDGEILIAFGHHDRAEFAAAVSRYAVEEWDPWVEPYSPRDVSLIYGVVDPSKDEPWLYWQTSPTHPGPFEVVPITTMHAEGYATRAPEVADMVSVLLDGADEVAEDIANDRLLATIYSYGGPDV